MLNIFIGVLGALVTKEIYDELYHYLWHKWDHNKRMRESNWWDYMEDEEEDDI